MQQFKVGDWAMDESGNHSPFQVDEDDLAQLPVEHNYLLNNCKRWQPKVGEWCWFYDKTSKEVPILSQFDYMSDNIYVTTEIQIHFSEEEPSAYGFSSCIPFIGTLPVLRH